MGDLFHEAVPFEFINRVFETIAACPQHAFQVLTKRAQRMRAYCEQRFEQHASAHPALGVAAAPWPNVWLGPASRTAGTSAAPPISDSPQQQSGSSRPSRCSGR